MESTEWLFSPLFPGQIGIWKCWFLWREENRSTRRKTLGAGTRTNNKLNPHMTPRPGIEPGPHWWEASAPNTAPSLLSTELSKHVWHLEDAGLSFNITWKILKQAAPFNPATNCCNLCLWEKYFIICRSDLATLNKPNELVTSCRLWNKFLLSKFKSPVATQ